MAHSKNCNYLGAAAVMDASERREALRAIQEREIARKSLQETIEVCQQIADILGTWAYRRWWKKAPNLGFLKYAKETLAELKNPKPAA